VRTDDIGGLRQAVVDAGAGRVTPILRDEFGSPAFPFRAPDGHAWTALGRAPT
jgi:hypothetical protein